MGYVTHLGIYAEAKCVFPQIYIHASKNSQYRILSKNFLLTPLASSLLKILLDSGEYEPLSQLHPPQVSKINQPIKMTGFRFVLTRCLRGGGGA